MGNRNTVDWDDLKVMSLDEFVSIGLLQEINRRFLHPIGLALSVRVDDETGKVLGFDNIWDLRDDPEGVVFDNEVIANGEAQAKAEKVEQLFNSKKARREEQLGFHIQPPRFTQPKEQK